MLIAHAPAGYIASRIVPKKRKVSYVICSMIFSLWPDLDLFYYYFIEKAGTFHHKYFTHLPIVVLISLLTTLPLTFFKRFKSFKVYYYLFFINWTVHLVLDTFTGGILWLYPFSNRMLVIVKIPPISQSWIISFVLHWSFIVELAIVALSVALLLKGKNNQ